MKISESFRISARALRSSKLRVMLTISGIVVGVFLIFVLLSVGSSTARQSMSIISDVAPNASVIVHGYFPVETGFENVTFSPSELLQKIEGNDEGLPLLGSKFEPEMAYTLQNKLPEGCAVTPLSVDLKTVTFGSRSRTVFLFATNENYPDVRDQGMMEGSYFSRKDKGRKVCVLGSYLKEKIFGDVEAVGRQVRVGSARYKVVGVLEPKGMSFTINNDDFLFVPYWIGGHSGGSKTDGFLVSSPTPEIMRETKEILVDSMNTLSGEESFTVVTQDDMFALAGDSIRLLDILSLIITMVAFLVGGVGIMNIMLVAVSERVREIGIRKALGAGRMDIVKQFLLESLLMGFIGGIVGIILGFGYVKLIEHLFSYPAYITVWSVVISLLFSIAVGTIFGVWPALKAANLDPVESISHRL